MSVAAVVGIGATETALVRVEAVAIGDDKVVTVGTDVGAHTEFARGVNCAIAGRPGRKELLPTLEVGSTIGELGAGRSVDVGLRFDALIVATSTLRGTIVVREISALIVLALIGLALIVLALIAATPLSVAAIVVRARVLSVAHILLRQGCDEEIGLIG